MNHWLVIENLKKHSAQFSVEFIGWFPDNLHVWDAFVREAMTVRRRGFKHYSARTIIHSLRHHSAIHEVGGPWKINDHHSPYLARLFDLCFPECAGMWEYRITKKVKNRHQPETCEAPT